jgi:hypothetical protein
MEKFVFINFSKFWYPPPPLRFDPIPCHGPFPHDASRLHSDTPHSAGILRTSDRQTQEPLPDYTQRSQQAGYMPPAGLEPAIPASVRPQTDALDRAATGIGLVRVRTAMCDVCLDTDSAGLAADVIGHRITCNYCNQHRVT